MSDMTEIIKQSTVIQDEIERLFKEHQNQSAPEYEVRFEHSDHPLNSFWVVHKSIKVLNAPHDHQWSTVFRVEYSESNLHYKEWSSVTYGRLLAEKAKLEGL